MAGDLASRLRRHKRDLLSIMATRPHLMDASMLDDLEDAAKKIELLATIEQERLERSAQFFEKSANLVWSNDEVADALRLMKFDSPMPSPDHSGGE